jgi:hypothetical protein
VSPTQSKKSDHLAGELLEEVLILHQGPPVGDPDRLLPKDAVSWGWLLFLGSQWRNLDEVGFHLRGRDSRLVRVAERRKDLVDRIELAVVMRLEAHASHIAAEQHLAGVPQAVECVLMAGRDLLVSL